MFLVDTNIWLEVLLDQEKSSSAFKFLEKMDSSYLNITDFSLYSIGIVLVRLKKLEILKKFMKDISESGVRILRLAIKDFEEIIENMEKYEMDFDDAYQYVAAEKYNLAIVSFDSDFDKTKKGRITPQRALEK